MDESRVGHIGYLGLLTVLGKCLLVAGLWGLTACRMDPPAEYDFERPVLSGPRQGLPAVVDLRISGGCAQDGEVNVMLRFSERMDRLSVERGIAIVETIGDMRDGEAVLGHPLRLGNDGAVFDWRDGDHAVRFSVRLDDDRQYVLTLPETVTDFSGKGLDGRVGADVTGDGVVDIRMEPGQYARIDDDYVALPRPFQSLPFFACNDHTAPSIWKVPLNHSRPRVLEFVGLMPNNEFVPAYRPAQGTFPFAVVDGAYVVERPLPPAGVLRLEIAAPATAPAHASFGHRWGPEPILPSSLAGNIFIEDMNLRRADAEVFLDDRLQVPAPLQGVVHSVSERTLTSDVLQGVPDDALAGMDVVARAANGYLYRLPIEANVGNMLTLGEYLYEEENVPRFSLDEPRSFFLQQGAFRENELQGLTVEGYGPSNNDVFTIERNGARRILLDAHTSFCPSFATCEFRVRTDLTVLGLQGAAFEIVPRYLYVRQEPQRVLNQVYALVLNAGENSIVDGNGTPFVDGRADGNERTAVVNDRWRVEFPSGDFSQRPLPPSLQINDGRWYSPFPTGLQTGAEIDMPPHGTFRYLSAGVYGQYETQCQAGRPVSRLRALALTFATPNGRTGQVGTDDLLVESTLHGDNVGAYRFEDDLPLPISIGVRSVTVDLPAYRNATLVGVLPTTLLLLEPTLAEGTLVRPGTDGLCGTADDVSAPRYRFWQPGDRLLISRRVAYPGGDRNTLDGNYDGILTNDIRDDVVLEYRPGDALEPFRRVP